MGTRYICDWCGRAFDVRGGELSGCGMPYGMPTEKWAAISCVVPRAEEDTEPGKTVRFYPTRPENMPVSYIVCSQTCAEKVLAEIETRLKAAFDEAAR